MVEQDNPKNFLLRKIIPIAIVIIIMLIFFISTRDYEKFKLLNRGDKTLDSQTEQIAEAMKECNKLANETYKNRCYLGIAHSVGYNNFENYSEACLKLAEDLRGTCYSGASERIGEEFYENLSLMFEKCEENGRDKESCKNVSTMNAAKMLVYNNLKFDYCDSINDNYKYKCYEGISWGLGNKYYPESKEQLVLDCGSLKSIYRPSCKYGILRAAAEYMSKNPSYARTLNSRGELVLQRSGIQPAKDFYDLAGFYSGRDHFKEQEVAFLICDNSSKRLDEEFKTICYESVFAGLGYSYYSDLVSKP